ncbi:hypothetical protein COT42_01525 [Candidatus Saganbacteria bacterium CG08_land_8_20_14_0_20_45_16]|uniref:Outer membrane lipoprotein carrier protein LolA n=1 Tax=Candidatus Saganbacteria bacterium CG08_land_8_20_14_0_20_45_16 TaxID=2014293 RepID=A0A2H0Y156_UNCSA|nr:MAG: hypothetical protein COT42_01525 [Candidatus Saganbacteria bacterium CG08_land_8_20_14_0_20_45_16]
MKKQWLFCFLIITLTCPASLAKLTPQQIVDKVTANFAKIQDAQLDFTLQYNLHLLGCTGTKKQTGVGYFQYPDKIKVLLDGVSYFAQGNKIRKIDKKGRRFYVHLINAPDLAPGFNPKLMAHNFDLSVAEEKPNEVILLGLPKPGVLKNVEKIYFYIDTQNYLLRRLNVIFFNKRLPGQIDIDYAKIAGVFVPTGLQGKSAVEAPGGFLVGLDLFLLSKDLKLNPGLPTSLFEAGF